MPEWSKKDERQYDHIKQSEKDRGKSNDLAQEIAARTVNKQRRKEGRTPDSETQGTGNPNSSLEERSKKELQNRAAQLKIRRRSTMTKEQLIQAIRSQ
jgi:hypothetical protein